MWRMGQHFVQAAVVALLVQPALAGDRLAALERFFGNYEGTTISDTSGGLSTRDLNISIEPYKDEGFTVTWTTIVKEANGESKTKKYQISFIEAGRDGLYKSAMRRNVFGHAVPLDPLTGEPYVWSSVVGDVLNIHALHITEDGGYEMQLHSRKLTPDGLATRFERVRDGEKLKLIEGELKKAK